MTAGEVMDYIATNADIDADVADAAAAADDDDDAGGDGDDTADDTGFVVGAKKPQYSEANSDMEK